MVKLLHGMLFLGIICDSMITVPSNLTNLLNNLDELDKDKEKVFISHISRAIPTTSDNVINDLDSFLGDIYERFIVLKQHHFNSHYKVFDTILQTLHTSMKKLDSFYDHFSTVCMTGSHYDQLQIKRPYEFDIDMTLDLSLRGIKDPELCDISLETISPAFVKMKICSQYWSQLRNDGLMNKTLFTWIDDERYLLASKFSEWFQNLVHLALNGFEKCDEHPIFYVEGVQYFVSVTGKAEPEMSLKITNASQGFELNVDLAPALKFPENRWPTLSGYRRILTQYSHDNFVLVPEPIKTGTEKVDGGTATKPVRNSSRSWRMSLFRQEGKMISGTNNLRKIIRFLKKLRDVQGMDCITSYKLKTLFLWEVEVRDDPNFWHQAPSKLFTIMVKKFKEALETGVIPYFWNRNGNLIENVERPILNEYANRLTRLVQILEESPVEYIKVAEFMLTPYELARYKMIRNEFGNKNV